MDWLKRIKSIYQKTSRGEIIEFITILALVSIVLLLFYLFT